MKARILAGVLAASVALASGSKPVAGGGVQAPGTVEVHTSNETVPAGSTAQVKFSFTQPRPISSTGPRMYMDTYSIEGIATFSPLGTTAGIGYVANKYLTVQLISPDNDLG